MGEDCVFGCGCDRRQNILMFHKEADSPTSAGNGVHAKGAFSSGFCVENLRITLRMFLSFRSMERSIYRWKDGWATEIDSMNS